MSVRRFRVLGTVQGVGFRPFVYRTAVNLGLDGWVANVDGHVEGEVAGGLRAIDEFAAHIRTEAPPLAHVRLVGLSTAHAVPRQGFHVRRSAPGHSRAASRDVPPDAAICDACLRELYDPTDRRHRYPFINCTDCGPRATIIEGLPYDRVRTTMRRFPACASEYGDPGSRRFHAEPVACPVCGPQLAWDDQRGEDALRAAAKTIAGGGIVAVKGLGGYQLVCDADSEDAVSELRLRKRRPAKPFAVMVRDIETAVHMARVSDTERACSHRRRVPSRCWRGADGTPSPRRLLPESHGSASSCPRPGCTISCWTKWPGPWSSPAAMSATNRSPSPTTEHIAISPP